jgi:hypothetical protein
MSGQSGNFNFGDLAKPVDRLIKCLSDAVGGYLRPWQIRRVAEAEGHALKIHTQAEIAAMDLMQRAEQRRMYEEAVHQQNMEQIAYLATEQLPPDAKPDDVEPDWYAHLLDRCRIVSNEEMQALWAKILAGEATNPGSFAKQTLNVVSSMSREDAMLFQSLCSFIVRIGVTHSPHVLIYDANESIHRNAGINLDNVLHLENIGLIRYEGLAGFRVVTEGLTFGVKYFDISTSITLDGTKREKGLLSLNTGLAIMTEPGEQLTSICDAKPIDGFLEYAAEQWKKDGASVTVSPPAAQ